MAKRKTWKNLQPHEKGFAKAILWAVCFAVVITILSLPRQRTYEDTSITVRQARSTGGGKYSNTKLEIISTDGRIFHVYNSEVTFTEIRALLTPGERAEVEYYEDWLVRLHLLGARPVLKLTHKGRVLVQNIPGDNTENFCLLWVCPVILLFGFLRWASGEHLLHKWKKKREKERKRRKKEGLTK